MSHCCGFIFFPSLPDMSELEDEVECRPAGCIVSMPLVLSFA